MDDPGPGAPVAQAGPLSGTKPAIWILDAQAASDRKRTMLITDSSLVQPEHQELPV